MEDRVPLRANRQPIAGVLHIAAGEDVSLRCQQRATDLEMRIRRVGFCCGALGSIKQFGSVHDEAIPAHLRKAIFAFSPHPNPLPEGERRAILSWAGRGRTLSSLPTQIPSPRDWLSSTGIARCGERSGEGRSLPARAIPDHAQHATCYWRREGGGFEASNTNPLSPRLTILNWHRLMRGEAGEGRSLPARAIPDHAQHAVSVPEHGLVGESQRLDAFGAQSKPLFAHPVPGLHRCCAGRHPAQSPDSVPRSKNREHRVPKDADGGIFDDSPDDHEDRTTAEPRRPWRHAAACGRTQ
jgi:hypothetical protein